MAKILFMCVKFPLLLTDPCDAVPQAHRVVHRCRQSVW